jgi:hypothetical protein
MIDSRLRGGNVIWKFSIIVALLACATAPAYAQDNRAEECWNPRAGHFEGVRPGETQNDLDFSRCHPTLQRGNERRNDEPRECWNPGAGHFEGVREGEQQNDLDFSRCRRR